MPTTAPTQPSDRLPARPHVNDPGGRAMARLARRTGPPASGGSPSPSPRTLTVRPAVRARYAQPWSRARPPTPMIRSQRSQLSPVAGQHPKSHPCPSSLGSDEVELLWSSLASTFLRRHSAQRLEPSSTLTREEPHYRSSRSRPTSSPGADRWETDATLRERVLCCFA